MWAMKKTLKMNLTKSIIVIVLSIATSFQCFAQLKNTVSAEGGMLIAARIDAVTILDKYALYEPHQKHGMYLSLGFELQKYDYEFLGLRQRLNLDLAAEALYILGLATLKGDWKDPDGRFGTTSYFSTGLFEYTFQLPLYTNDYISTGAGGALFDLNYTHYLYDANGQPINPNKSDVSQYGFYGGWSIFIDAMLLESLTLHTDFYYGYSFYNSSQDKLKNAGEPAQPFNTWKITSSLLYENGLFVTARFQKIVNKTSIPTAASRFTIGIGYRFGMW